MAQLGLLNGTRAAIPQFALALLLTSCTIGNGIADFGNDVTTQHPITFGKPQRVVAGTFSSPIVDPWDDRGAVVIAFEYIDGSPHLAMRPVDGSQGCDTGISYSSVVRDKLPDRVQLVAYTGTGPKDQVPLHFIDHNCNEYGPPIVGASLPEMLYTDPPGYLVRVAAIQADKSVATQYWAVDPWNSTSRVLASNVTWYSLLSKETQTIGVIDSGHFKIFDGHQVQTADVGSAISELILLAGPSGPFLTVDGGVLRKYQSTTDTAPVELAKDVCQVAPDGGAALYFMSPCSTRQLQHYHLDSGQSTAIDIGVGSLISSRNKAGTSDVFALYTKPMAPSGQELWLYTPDAAPVLAVSNFNRLYDWSPPPALQILAMVNSNGATAQVVRHDNAGDSLLLDHVSTASPGLLGNFDATAAVGDLYFPLQLGATPQLAAKGVPFDANFSAIITPPGPPATSNLTQYGTAVIANATAGMGDLQLMRYPSPSSPGPQTPITLASKVPMGKVDFFSAMSVIMYLENWDKTLKHGHLVSKELTLDARTDISDEVREFQEVKWPQEGVMFVVGDGDRAGIWVAKAK